MADERKLSRSAYSNFLGGADEGRATPLLADNQVARALNKTFRGGYADQRPPFLSCALIFDNAEQSEWVATHRLQGWSRDPFVLGNKTLIIFSSGGRIFRLDVDGFKVAEITPTQPATTTTILTVPGIGVATTVSVDLPDKILVGYPVTIAGHRYLVDSKIGQSLTLTNLDDTGITIAAGAPLSYLDPNPQRVEQVWMYQADKFWIIQDNESLPIIYDGGTTRRSNGVDEVPTGSMGAFIRDRIWQVVGLEIAVGDIFRGPTPVTSFTEEHVLATQGRFQLSAGDGEITAITTMVTVHSQYPQGPVIVFTTAGAIAINVPANRQLWKQQNFPLVTLALIDAGATGQYSTVPANSDLFYRATDGVRSFRLSSDQYAQWGSVPDSREMTETFNGDTEELLHFASAIVFDNRLLVTTNGTTSTVGVWHRGMAVLDFDLLSGLGQKQRPVWDGLWTGMKVLGLMAGTFKKKKRAFAFVRNADGRVEFWEILTRGKFDYDLSHRVESAMESRAFALYKKPDGSIDAQKLEAVEIWVDRVAGIVNFELLYRPEGSPCWYPWGITIQICAKNKDCSGTDDGSPLGPGECRTFQDFKEGYRTRIGFGQPIDYPEPMERRPTRTAYAHEIRLWQVGAARVRRIIVKASQVEEPGWKVAESACPVGTVPVYTPQLTVECVTPNQSRHWGMVQNETTGLWHLIRCRNYQNNPAPGTTVEFFLGEEGVP